MAARSVDPPGRDVRPVRGLAGPPAARGWRHGLSYRLAVVAPATAEAVLAAGGWLVDGVLAGWDAVLLTAGGCDPLVARILGARPGSLEDAVSAPPRWPQAQSLAVHAGLYRSDPRVRRLADLAVERGDADLRLFGDRCLVEDDCAHGAVRHHLSVAARAFKTQALLAAAAPVERVERTEAFDLAGLATVRGATAVPVVAAVAGAPGEA